jgi:hypothetical protein
MDARTALIKLLSSTLVHRRDRYVELASKPKTQNKFLNEFYHRLAECFDRRKVVSELPEDAWRSPAYVFEPPSTFGTRKESLRRAHQDAREAYLLVTEDGRFAVHMPEDRVDDTLFLRVEDPVRP